MVLQVEGVPDRARGQFDRQAVARVGRGGAGAQDEVGVLGEGRGHGDLPGVGGHAHDVAVHPYAAFAGVLARLGDVVGAVERVRVAFACDEVLAEPGAGGVQLDGDAAGEQADVGAEPDGQHLAGLQPAGEEGLLEAAVVQHQGDGAGEEEGGARLAIGVAERAAGPLEGERPVRESGPETRIHVDAQAAVELAAVQAGRHAAAGGHGYDLRVAPLGRVERRRGEVVRLGADGIGPGRDGKLLREMGVVFLADGLAGAVRDADQEGPDVGNSGCGAGGRRTELGDIDEQRPLGTRPEEILAGRGQQ